MSISGMYDAEQPRVELWPVTCTLTVIGQPAVRLFD